jgi:ribosomal protein S15P/S13E
MKKRNIKYRTDFLLPRNSFWVGMGSVLNISGSYFEYRYSKSNNEADMQALISDWNNVGEDLKNAKKDFETKNGDKLCLK